MFSHDNQISATTTALQALPLPQPEPAQHTRNHPTFDFHLTRYHCELPHFFDFKNHTQAAPVAPQNYPLPFGAC